MTTIAWDGKSLAADRQMENCGWIVPGKASKLRALPRRTFAAICGDYAKFDPFLDWFASANAATGPFDLGEDTRVIVVRAGIAGFVVYEGKGSFTLEAPWGAWGSGWPAAVAAMHMGADARRAIEIAALVDPSTGSDVEVFLVNEAVA